MGNRVDERRNFMKNGVKIVIFMAKMCILSVIMVLKGIKNGGN